MDGNDGNTALRQTVDGPRPLVTRVWNAPEPPAPEKCVNCKHPVAPGTAYSAMCPECGLKVSERDPKRWDRRVLALNWAVAIGIAAVLGIGLVSLIILRGFGVLQ